MTVNMPRGRRRRDAFGAWKSPFALLALLAFAGAAAGWPADLRGPVSATAPASLGVVLLLTAPAKGRAGAMACSGTAITRDLIVTAAHCLAGRGNVTIVRSVNRTSVLEPAAATYVHPNFYRTDDKVPKNDIAFVRSASPLEEPQMLLNMDAADHLDDIGVHSTTCGFGQNNDVVSMDGTTPMNALEVPGVQGGPFYLGCAPGNVTHECTLALQRDPGAGQLCESFDHPPQTTACFGDSGGPSFVEHGERRYLIGLVSWGAGDCSLPHAAFTKVSYHADFIAETICGVHGDRSSECLALKTKAAPMLVVNDRPSPATGRLNGISAALSYGLAVLGVHVALV